MLKVKSVNPNQFSVPDISIRALDSRLVSLTREIEPVDLLTFLQRAPAGSRRVFWENRQVATTFAGFGVAAELFASGGDRFAVIAEETRRLFNNAIIETPTAQAGPRVMGGFAFKPEFEADRFWEAFPAASFMLPRYQLTRSGDQAWLTLNTRITGEVDFPRLHTELHTLAAQVATLTTFNPPPGGTAVQVDYPLTRDAWRQQITDATRRMKAGELEKVVLSRGCDLTLDADVNPLAIHQRLRDRYPDTFRFLLEPSVGYAFFGATPELLITTRGQQLTTAALAGSIRRGQTPDDDAQLAALLLDNPKERHEHHLVVQALHDLLQPLTTRLEVPAAPGVLKLSNIQHLYTPITGELSHRLHVLEMVEKLHPTPALGGAPRPLAMETIRQSEIIPRGWYAAPVGWIDADANGTFAVAIRSAVSSGSHARLYAGAGIVADSDPDREWDEINLKFRPMLDALNAGTLPAQP